MISRIRNQWQLIVILVILLPILALFGFWGYVQIASYSADIDYVERIEQNKNITITEYSSYYALTPDAVDESKSAIIYYPGGLVDPGSYLYKMGNVAIELETKVFITKPYFNLVITGISASDGIIEQEALSQPVIGGHSLGVVAACRYTNNSPESVAGLFLFGSYCDVDISDQDTIVVSIMGLEDGIIDRGNYQESKSSLPARTNIVEIEQLNHSDFGNYGLQSGDNPSQLSDEEVIELLSGNLEFFEIVSN